MSKLVKISDDKICNNQIIRDYVDYVGLENLNGCTGASIWDDFCEYCEKNKIPNNYSKLGFSQRLVIEFPLRSKPVRRGKKVFKAMFVY